MCGIIGLFNPSSNVANEIYDGLIQLQHRGQDAAGIATLEQSKIQLHKDLGLVTEAFKSEKSKISIRNIRREGNDTSRRYFGDQRYSSI